MNNMGNNGNSNRNYNNKLIDKYDKKDAING